MQVKLFNNTYIQQQASVKKSDIGAVLDELGEAMKHYFELGQKVRIKGLGIYFTKPLARHLPDHQRRMRMMPRIFSSRAKPTHMPTRPKPSGMPMT